MELLFENAYASFAASKQTADDEATFYSSSAFKSYYTYHFNKSYKEYMLFTPEDLADEEEILHDLRASTVKLVFQIKEKQPLGLTEYKICCEIDAELDALHAAQRRRTRSWSM